MTGYFYLAMCLLCLLPTFSGDCNKQEKFRKKNKIVYKTCLQTNGEALQSVK